MADHCSSEACASASLGLRYQCNEESGALLVLSRPGHKTSLDCSMHIRRYMRTHLASWCDFANGHLGIGLEDKDIIFVSGFVKTSVWATAAFHNSSASGELVIAAGCFGPSASGEFRVSLSRGSNASVFSRAGPLDRLTKWNKSGELDEECDQCIFLNYYKMKNRKWRRPAVMRAAAGPHQLPHDSDDSDGGFAGSHSGGSLNSSSDGSCDQFTQVGAFNACRVGESHVYTGLRPC